MPRFFAESLGRQLPKEQVFYFRSQLFLLNRSLLKDLDVSSHKIQTETEETIYRKRKKSGRCIIHLLIYVWEPVVEVCIVDGMNRATLCWYINLNRYNIHNIIYVGLYELIWATLSPIWAHFQPRLSIRFKHHKFIFES